ncbi:MAG: AMP-binding protein [Proteobacteria bacterium]|nr:AMP-binding protein [Pseudomonadota bacterium]
MYQTPQTIPGMLKRNVVDFPDREAFVSVSHRTGAWVRYTWLDLDRLSDRLAAGLAGLGVRRKDKVAFLHGNSAECYLAYLAIHKLGAMFVPINARLVAREVEFILGHAEADYVILGSDFLSLADEIRGRLPVKSWVCMEKEGRALPEWTVSFAALLETSGPPPDVEIGPHDEADLLYTTGTTGMPKGVILTQVNKIACGRMLGASAGLSRRQYGWDRCQNAFPFFTSTGVSSVLMNWLYYGFTQILEPVFEVEATLETIARERTTFYGGAPSMFIFLLDHPRFKEYDTSSLRTVSSGGSAMPEEVTRRMMEAWPGLRIYNFYGLTEGGVGGTYLDASDALRKLGSIGTPWVPDQEARIVDDAGRDAAPGEVGEIAIRGPNIMKGYYKNPEATADTLRNGWLHTGDMGYYDEEGYFFYTDRMKDMIVRGGFNIYPVEVESVLFEHPSVLQVAVIAKPHPKLGEDVLALVVPAKGRQVEPRELMDFCSDKLADFKRPREIVFVESLPLNPMGKMDKKALRAQYMNRDS